MGDMKTVSLEDPLAVPLPIPHGLMNGHDVDAKEAPTLVGLESLFEKLCLGFAHKRSSLNYGHVRVVIRPRGQLLFHHPNDLGLHIPAWRRFIKWHRSLWYASGSPKADVETQWFLRALP